MTSITYKIREVGIKNTIVGGAKQIRYSQLQKKYGFLKWNVSPYELRPYIQACAKYINATGHQSVMDVGCGLGEMLRHVNCEKRIGFDVEAESIRAAKYLDKKHDIDFRVGTFDKIRGLNADILVSLNFMHVKKELYWKPIYEVVLKENDFKEIMVDSITPTEGQHHLNWGEILPDNYQKVKEMGPYRFGRVIQVYRKL